MNAKVFIVLLTAFLLTILSGFLKTPAQATSHCTLTFSDGTVAQKTGNSVPFTVTFYVTGAWGGYGIDIETRPEPTSNVWVYVKTVGAIVPDNQKPRTDLNSAQTYRATAHDSSGAQCKNTLYVDLASAAPPPVGGGNTGGCDSFLSCVGGGPSELAGKGFTASGLPGQIISKFLPAFLALMGFLTVIMIVISGIQFILSSGNPEAAAGARGRLTYAIIGFIIIVMAFAILQIVNRLFLNTGVV